MSKPLLGPVRIPRQVATGSGSGWRTPERQVLSAMAGEAKEEPSTIRRLSERERQIAALVAHGMKSRDIAQELHISENTVKRHLQAIFNKTGRATAWSWR